MTTENSKSTREIAGDIVSAYLSNNQMVAEQVPDFIRSVVSALDTDAAANGAAAPEEPAKPAVSIKRSVRDDAVVCLECGSAKKTLKRHIGSAHGLSEGEYRAKWGLPNTHPIVAPSYSRDRSSMAKKIGLGQRTAGQARDGSAKAGQAKKSGGRGRAKAS